ncbi:OmpA family protein [Rhizobium sp. DBTS2]|uniref:OmpA family protein n=2 Tax=Mycoplana rhizolycopersici TaxID=2746702 RepID=A0ABX2QJR9_9HYPH|nr:OmpA family protein [Rhizobium rhizolycopersici]
MLLQPAYAAPYRAMQTVGNEQGVILVQSNDGDLSEEEQRKLRRQQRQQQEQQGGQQQERKKNREQAQDGEQKSDREKAREERRKQREAQQGGGNEEQGKPNRERKQAGQQGDGQNRPAQKEQQSDREKAREERRKQREAQQGGNEEQGKPNRERKPAEQQGDGQNRPAQKEQQSDREKAREERRKQREAQQGGANEEQGKPNRDRNQAEQQGDGQNRPAQKEQQSDREKAREERRKQREAQQGGNEEQGRPNRDRNQAEQQGDRKDAGQNRGAQDRNQADREQSDREKAREERRKKAEADRDRRTSEDNRERPRRERDPERERIARDPSRTTETIDLPVVGGAAVLDSDKDADRRAGSRESREESRRKRQEERRNVNVRVPRSDADAQVDRDGNRRSYERREAIDRERGERRDRRPNYRDPDNVRIGRREDNRVIYNIDNRTFVRHYDSDRLSRRGGDTYYETLRGGRVRETIERPGGVRVVTIRNEYGTVIQRSRFVGDREYVLYYVPEVDYVDDRPFYDPGLDLPPMRLGIPVDEYIIDTSSDYDRDYRAFLDLPPVEPVERVYTLDEVKYSARIRDKVRRIDLDTITFATGSADISMEQASTLRRVADAINDLLDQDPSETFLIEGHTDAVGSDESNLILSDERAESVANVLTDVYDIPPENLSTQGYGERYLKVTTDGPEQLNRRVTIRRVTPLVKPVASAE